MEAQKSTDNQTVVVSFEKIFVKEEKVLPAEAIENHIETTSLCDIIKEEPTTEIISINIKTEPIDSDVLDNNKNSQIELLVDPKKPVVKTVVQDDGSSSRSKLQAKMKQLAADNKCDVCNKTFRTKLQLLQHNHKAHANNNPFECKQCKKKFPKKQLLVIHLSDHAGNPNFLLGQQLTNIANEPEVLANDIQTDPSLLMPLYTDAPTAEKPFQCKVCYRTFAQKSYLSTHLKRHTKEKAYECPICHLKFTEKKSVERHSVVHLRESTVKDEKSKEISSTADQEINLDESKEMQPDEASTEKSLKCKECGETFSENQNLKKHLMAHAKKIPYGCSKCNKVFTEQYHLTLHMRTHSGEKIYQCEDCDKKFLSLPIFNSHRRIHSDKNVIPQPIKTSSHKSFVCPICQKILSRKCRLIKHLSLHSENKGFFECAECKKRFHLKQRLNIHIKKEHTNPKLHECEECGKRFALRTHLTVHRKSHSDEKPFGCDLCSLKFISPGKLNEHLRTSHPEARRHQCLECDKSFWYEYNLKEHMRSHSKERPFECHLCNKTFRHTKHLNEHLRYVHKDEKLYVCNKCNETFETESFLARHEQLHTGTESLNFICDVCGKEYTFKWQLKAHFIVHTGEKPFECNVCTKRFMYKSSLKKHSLKPCENKSGYVCDKCDKKFHKKYSLTRHLRTHSEEKLFHCKMCNKSFKSKDSRNKHLRLHCQEKRFECVECKEKFISNDDLEEHAKVHKIDEVYHCIQCNESFPNCTDLEVHEKIHSIKNEEILL